MTSQSSNPVSYARGVLEVQADTYRKERDAAWRALTRICAAYHPGTDLDLDVTIRKAVDLPNTERP